MKKGLLIYVLIYVSTIFLNGQVSEIDSLALVALYNNTDGSNWTNNTNWLQSGQPVSTWYGIVVRDNRVEIIHLPQNNLTGTLPDDMGDLTNLENLNLSDNAIEGSIPGEIGNLVSLIWLNLDFNQLSESIPSEIGNLVNLRDLRLRCNHLTGPIPEGICNLTELEQLTLNRNQLSDSIPECIGNLASLKYLALDNNNLIGNIPGEIGNLTNLYCLNLASNELTGHIPEEIGGLTKMTWLSMEMNQLDGEIPPTIGNLTLLNSLGLRENELTGPIPSEIGNLTKLEYLYLFLNHLEGTIPAEIGNLKILKTLYIGNNELSGNIPEEIWSLDSLKALSLEYNELTGNIPPEIGNLKKLNCIMLERNQLSGSIPEEIVNLNKLVAIDLNTNELSGPIPEGIKDLPDLTSFLIHHNYFNFYDLEPLTGLAIGKFLYYMQGSVALNTDQVNCVTGNDLDIDITDLSLSECSVANNQYQWWKDGSGITSYSDSPVLSLTDLDISDEGQYYCTMINSDFPDLVLTTDTFSLVIDGPVDITLSPDSVNENIVSGTLVGILSVEDPNQLEGHDFALVEGDGTNDADNDIFSIHGDSLIIDTSPDYESWQEYHIYIRVTDDDSKTFDKALVIYVNDLQESEPNAFTSKDIEKNAIKVYPNPSDNLLLIQVNKTEIKDLQYVLYDMNGKALKQETLAGDIGVVNMATYPAGLYLLKLLKRDREIETFEIIKY